MSVDTDGFAGQPFNIFLCEHIDIFGIEGPETIDKIDRGNRRQARMNEGLNDNRFVTKTVQSKKAYKRKSKHKNQY